jgi:hypothetical protein
LRFVRLPGSIGGGWLALTKLNIFSAIFSDGEEATEK